jgi:hypothetical protein
MFKVGVQTSLWVTLIVIMVLMLLKGEAQEEWHSI